MKTTQHVTIEKTAKKYKLVKALCALLFVGDAFWCLFIKAGADLNSTEPSYLGPVILAAATFVVYLFNRLAIWWNHG